VAVSTRAGTTSIGATGRVSWAMLMNCRLYPAVARLPGIIDVCDIHEVASPHLRQSKARIGGKAGKYTLDRLIDVGGMAAVYEATRWRKKVAIKVLHTAYMRVPEARIRFAREGYAANRVKHDNVVKLIDDGELPEGNPFFVMELLEGWSLEQRLAAEPPPIVEEAWWVADQVLEVLIAAHDKDVIHRDIKPGNIYLTHDDQVKVLDFGLARLRDGDGAGRMTQTGTVIGTASYMPPEQALRKPDLIDGRSDLWSVGAIVFRMLAGRTVHDQQSTGASLIAAATKKATKLASVAADVPPAVAAVVDRALSFNKEQRFPDAAAMRNALNEAFAGGVMPSSGRPSQPRSSVAPPSSEIPISVEEISVNVRYSETPEGDSIIVTFEDVGGDEEQVELRRSEDEDAGALDYDVVDRERDDGEL
jgi:eukaryotic-like serine/threonine-protein kinase